MVLAFLIECLKAASRALFAYRLPIGMEVWDLHYDADGKVCGCRGTGGRVLDFNKQRSKGLVEVGRILVMDHDLGELGYLPRGCCVFYVTPALARHPELVAMVRKNM